jgi:hypothetical protein
VDQEQVWVHITRGKHVAALRGNPAAQAQLQGAQVGLEFEAAQTAAGEEGTLVRKTTTQNNNSSAGYQTCCRWQAACGSMERLPTQRLTWMWDLHAAVNSHVTLGGHVQPQPQPQPQRCYK